MVTRYVSVVLLITMPSLVFSMAGFSESIDSIKKALFKNMAHQRENEVNAIELKNLNSSEKTSEEPDVLGLAEEKQVDGVDGIADYDEVNALIDSFLEGDEPGSAHTGFVGDVPAIELRDLPRKAPLAREDRLISHSQGVPRGEHVRKITIYAPEEAPVRYTYKEFLELQALKKAYAEDNSEVDKTTIMHWALSVKPPKNLHEIYLLLVGKVALKNLSIKNAQTGELPLHSACKNGHTATAHLFERSDVRLTNMPDVKGNTPFHLFLMHIEQSDLERQKLLLGRLEEIVSKVSLILNARNEQGVTPAQLITRIQERV
jgi:ankyrin repeat protein